MSTETKDKSKANTKRLAIIKQTALNLKREALGAEISLALSGSSSASNTLATLIDEAYKYDGKIGPKQLEKNSTGKYIATFGKVNLIEKISPKGKQTFWMNAPCVMAAHDAIHGRMDLATDDSLYVDKTGYGNLKRDLNRALSRVAAKLQSPSLRVCGTGRSVPFHVECADPVEQVPLNFKQSLQKVVDRFVKDGMTIAIASREMAQMAASISPQLKAAKKKAA